jgi:diacylglycerol kinase (ATP)
LDELLGAFEPGTISGVWKTTHPGEEAALTESAIRNGATSIVAIGGDGTCSRVAAAIVRSGRSCKLGVAACGTGNDFAKTLGVLDYTPKQTAGIVVGGQGTTIDVGLADDHYFINSCGFGFDASVLQATTRVRFLKGDAVYIYAALRQLFTYRGVQVSADSILEGTARPMLMVIVSNGRFLGGAFHIAPRASVLDGQLDCCFLGDTNVLERMRVFSGAFRGTHGRRPSVTSKLIRTMTLGFVEPPMMEVDGELRQARSSNVRIECVPRALDVIAAPGYPL